jgi:hypothetical protein
MTSSESTIAADPGDSAPPFPVADWGYDRRLVDARVAELVQQLAEERRRGDQAERALSRLQLGIHPPRPQAREGAALEADMAQVLEQAGVIAARVLEGRQTDRSHEARLEPLGSPDLYKNTEALNSASGRRAHSLFQSL